jgi:HEAT repeat protein
MFTPIALAFVLALQGPGGGGPPPAEGGGTGGRPQQPPAGAPADPKAIEECVASLQAAFGKDGSTAKKLDALGKASAIVDARVVAAAKEGLGDKEASVVAATVETLGQLRHPSALEALQGFYKKEHKKLADDLTLMPALVKAIGRHGSPSSIALLKEDAFDQKTYLTAQARILSLGNIRTVESLEALIDLSKMVGPNRMDGLRSDMRLSIARLTGVDLGPESTAWTRWWNDNKKGFEVAKEPPKLDTGLQRQWESYWGVPREGEGRGRRRGEGRGGEAGGGAGEGGGEGGDTGGGGGGGRRGGLPPGAGGGRGGGRGGG